MTDAEWALIGMAQIFSRSHSPKAGPAIGP
jgi:hypothetical protein